MEGKDSLDTRNVFGAFISPAVPGESFHDSPTLRHEGEELFLSAGGGSTEHAVQFVSHNDRPWLNQYQQVNFGTSDGEELWVYLRKWKSGSKDALAACWSDGFKMDYFTVSAKNRHRNTHRVEKEQTSDDRAFWLQVPGTISSKNHSARN